MSGSPIVSYGLLGLGTAVLVTPLLLAANKRLKLNRSQEFHHLNQAPVPRLGGLVLTVAFLAIEIFIYLFDPQEVTRLPERRMVIVSSLVMFVLGFWDDLRPLGAKKKLAGQVIIAGFVWFSGIGIQELKIPFSDHPIAPGGWGALLTIAWLVGITNLVNLIDGVDGLAGGICLMLMGLLVYVGSQNGTFVFLTSGMTGALLGFLCFNFPPARIYLGDGGAYFLGFQIGLFSLVGSHKGAIVGALIAPLFVLALPIVDTSLAIMRRGLRGLPIFRPDRNHIHHHLLGSGMSRRKTVLSLYAVTLMFLLMGFAVSWSRGQLIPILFGVGLVVLLLCAGKLSFSREWFAVGRTLGNSVAMRQEIQYALCLMHWLAQEGQRCPTLPELFRDFAEAARRLGFTSLKLTLADRHALWTLPHACGPFLCATHSLQGGICGVLELHAPTCRLKNRSNAIQARVRCVEPCCPAITDSRLFEITGELLAEAWIKATRNWAQDDAPLRFDLRLPVVKGVARRPKPRLLPADGHKCGSNQIINNSWRPHGGMINAN